MGIAHIVRLRWNRQPNRRRQILIKQATIVGWQLVSAIAGAVVGRKLDHIARSRFVPHAVMVVGQPPPTRLQQQLVDVDSDHIFGHAGKRKLPPA